MKTSVLKASFFLFGLVTAGGVYAADGKETDCTNGKDDDGDTVFDCGDSDCKADPACKPDGREEATEATCSDWIDNDGDGHIDCDDDGCANGQIKACMGSWDVQTGKMKAGSGSDDDALPDLGPGGRVEDLIGKGDDKDGERSDEVCADGIDNDGDGKTDCDDFGCRFDPQVSVCRENPGMRFSIVSHIAQIYDVEADTMDTRFTVLQLRAFGPIPFIQDSFFLVSMRAERTPRLTFAMFQVPLGKGHYLNINSGGGGLSTALIRSASKQLLIDSPYYLYNAFEQGNGAAIELGGQLDDEGTIDYRVFLAGGSGRSNGNVGGRYFTFDNTNYTWTVGAQIGVDLIGSLTRWDNPLLYTKVPTALGFTFGMKYDQRAQERYPAANLNLTFRSGGFVGSAETYIKRELEFGSWQVAYNVSAGYLLVPKMLMLAADVGQYVPGDMDNAPAVAETDVARQLDELQWRVGLHYYFFRNIGVLSAIYTDRTVANKVDGDPDTHERTFKFVGQYRF
ncbi:MAG: hypothetical protein JNJ59_11125 [Deltaproteobacteria bacterium]|jgi:hypothetical protein|nr:hypothetical protein [Deltaproteobacteria bacterium]